MNLRSDHPPIYAAQDKSGGTSSRRGILALLGFAPAAAAIGLKDAAARAGINMSGLGSHLPGTGYGAPVATGGDSQRFALRALYRLVGVPEWQKRQMHRESSYVERLDPDLASVRSFSLSARVRMQATRNYERRLNRVNTLLDEEEASELFRQKHGDRLWL